MGDSTSKKNPPKEPLNVETEDGTLKTIYITLSLMRLLVKNIKLGLNVGIALLE